MMVACIACDMGREVASETVRRMVRAVDTGWTVRRTSAVESGFSAVHRVTVETGATTQEIFLKATPDGEEHGIPADARIMGVLGASTSIPVPEVLGVVDEHADLPAPFLCTTAVPGSEVAYEEVGWVPDSFLRTTARQIGAHLGELHGVDAVGSFGHVTHDRTRTLAGGRPSGSVADLTVADGFDSWVSFLDAWVSRELERHRSSRFASLTPRLESWCQARVADTTDTDGPVLGRNDHGFHNLLVDPDTGAVTAMLDWAYTLAVTPAFDLQYAVYLFSGAFLAGIPEVPDRRALVRDAMLEGYRRTAPERIEAVATTDPLYEVLAAMRVMIDFDQLAPRLPAGTADVVAGGLERDVESILDEAA